MVDDLVCWGVVKLAVRRRRRRYSLPLLFHDSGFAVPKSRFVLHPQHTMRGEVLSQGLIYTDRILILLERINNCPATTQGPILVISGCNRYDRRYEIARTAFRVCRADEKHRHTNSGGENFVQY